MSLLKSLNLNFTNTNTLIIGDVMLDEYWTGEATRISPEAPVPILLMEQKHYRAGGAANVAINMYHLGAKVDLIGVIGKDSAGDVLKKLLNYPSYLNNFLMVAKHHPTIHKLRIISNNQQLFRIDQEKQFNSDLSIFDNLVAIFKQNIAINQYKAIILSDYNKGTLPNIQTFINTANSFNIPIIIDSKSPNFLQFKHASILTPNFKEFQQMVDVHIEHTVPFAAYQAVMLEKGHNLIEQLNLKALIITQGKHGLTLLTHDYQDQHFNSYCHEVFDVTGAGDTVTAMIAACIANGYSLQQAAQLATIAAGIVVKKLWTSYASIAELQQELAKMLVMHSDDAINNINDIVNNDIVNNDEVVNALSIPTNIANLNANVANHLTSRVSKNNIFTNTINDLELGCILEDKLFMILQQLKLLGEIIVLVNGCFDILHAGHIHYLEKAKSFGHRLIVAVNTDESIKALKGAHRPINTLAQRMQVLAGLKAVDWVISFGSATELTPGRLIAKLSPNILIKSKEYYNDITEIPASEGADHVINNGGQVYLLDRPLIKQFDISSTQLIATIKNTVMIENN